MKNLTTEDKIRQYTKNGHVRLSRIPYDYSLVKPVPKYLKTPLVIEMIFSVIAFIVLLLLIPTVNAGWYELLLCFIGSVIFLGLIVGSIAISDYHMFTGNKSFEEKREDFMIHKLSFIRNILLPKELHLFYYGAKNEIDDYKDIIPVFPNESYISPESPFYEPTVIYMASITDLVNSPAATSAPQATLRAISDLNATYNNTIHSMKKNVEKDILMFNDPKSKSLEAEIRIKSFDINQPFQ